MKILLKVGWRNLWRNKRRSLVVASTIAIGIFTMLLSIALINGMNTQMVENNIRTALGHIAVQHPDYQKDPKLAHRFAPPPDLLNRIDAIPGVLGAAPRLKVEGMIRSSEASRGVLITGIDPARERQVSGLFEYTAQKDDSQFLDDPQAQTVLISKFMSDKLELLPGDRTVLMFQDTAQELIGAAFTVQGIYQSPIDSFDKFVVFTGIEALQSLTGVDNAVSQITLRVADREKTDTVMMQLAPQVDNTKATVLSWKEMAPQLVRAIALFDTMMVVFFAIVFSTVVFTIANTLIMAVMERFHEIGVMKSIGTRPFWIAAMVLCEAVGLAQVGLAGGVVLASILVAILGTIGIDFSFYMESMRTFGTGHVIYPRLKPGDLVSSGLIVLATTIIATLYPAVKAARIKPLEALHLV